MLTDSVCDNKNNGIQGGGDIENLSNLHPVLYKPSLLVKELENENPHDDIVDPQLSSINIASSTDVVIGPLTQFHGPVTIYQNAGTDSKPQSNVNFEKSAKPTSEANDSFDHKNPVTAKTSKSRKYAIYASIIVVMISTIVVTLTLTLNLTSNNVETGKEVETTTTKIDEKKPLGNHIMYTPQEWGGRKPLNFTKPLNHPTEYVLISHTAGRFCKTFLKCSSIMQQIQAMHVANGSPDIGYNFLIGGDGNIYIGRGWDIRNFHTDNNVGICFIGNYIFDELTPDMISALEQLLEEGVKLKKLHPDYKLVSHNQTYATLSPGNNVYKVISKLPHFYPRSVKIH